VLKQWKQHVKLARKWSYEVKGISENAAKIIVCENNFHGRTTTIVSFSNDPDANQNYGPLLQVLLKFLTTILKL
jgi:ornithine--oxo-acid transaminase